jgi:3-oxoacyl-[acyl-carrier protein] reductase
MSGKLEGKVALITGASRGIGRSIAELFAQEGAKLGINYSSSGKAAEELGAALNRSGHETIVLKADVSKEGEVKDMVKKTLDHFGRIDVLVNNAGILRAADIFALKDEDLDAMFDVNVKGTLYCTREVARHMIDSHRGGKVVNISSNAGVGTAFRNTTAYALTKASVMVLTKRLAFELAGMNINVNSVAPGYTETDMVTTGKTKEQFEKAVADVSARAMLNRIAKPIEIAKTVLFLASDDSSFMTGQNVIVDGGRMDYLTHGF